MGNRVQTGYSALYGAVGGRQDQVRGGGAAATFDAATTLVELGALPTGTYKFQLPSGGAAGLDCSLKLASHTGTVPTAKLYATYADGVTQKGTAVAFGALSDGAVVLASLTTLRGEQFTMLELTVPATSSATFGQGEYSAM